MSELSPELDGLAADFVVDDGDVLLYEEDLERWRETLLQAPAARHEQLSVDLLALSLMLRREAGDAAYHGVVQLMELCAALLASAEQAEALFAAAGAVNLEASAALTGGEAPAKRPVSDGGPAGPGSLFALRVGKHRED